MISVEQAKNIILSQSSDWGQHQVALVYSLGEVLAEDIYADRDFPPFHRVAMDGIALSHQAYAAGQREFEVQDMQLAGVPALTLQNSNSAIEIMTGAVLSVGCDLVIRYEDLEFFEKEEKRWVRINLDDASPMANIHQQGSDQSRGQLLIRKGAVITAAEVAIMATVGCDRVSVNRKPKVAIISTGDELVDVTETPLPYQIRKSNSVAIESSLVQLKIPCQRFHMPDDKRMLHEQLGTVLNEYDVLLLSGGVSMGRADYLPEVLEALGVEKLFHKVAQRPGKPFWFGSHDKGARVFAFPGNPISTYACYTVYFIPWLMNNWGKKYEVRYATLMEDFVFKPSLGYFMQVRSQVQEDRCIHAYPQQGRGSGDLANLAQSDAFLYLSADQTEFKSGQVFEYYSFDVSSLA